MSQTRRCPGLQSTPLAFPSELPHCHHCLVHYALVHCHLVNIPAYQGTKWLLCVRHARCSGCIRPHKRPPKLQHQETCPGCSGTTVSACDVPSGRNYPFFYLLGRSLFTFQDGSSNVTLSRKPSLIYPIPSSVSQTTSDQSGLSFHTLSVSNLPPKTHLTVVLPPTDPVCPSAQL